MNYDITRILGKIGPSREALYYWSLYKSLPPDKFAVIKISGECIGDPRTPNGSLKSLEKLAEDIYDLYSLGLIPTITHGWGRTLNERLKAAGIESKFHPETNDRITNEQEMREVEKIATETIEYLARAIHDASSHNARVKIIKDVIIAKDKEEQGYGTHNGDIVRINIQPVIDAITQGFIPLVSPIGVSEDGKKHYNLNASSVGAYLARTLDPFKYLMVTEKGGVLKDVGIAHSIENHSNGNIISEIILRRQYKKYLEDGVISGGMKKNVDEADLCLTMRENGDDRTVQIVSPYNLMHELFSREGAGTLIRKGYIVEPRPLLAVNQRVIRDLVETRFGETLRDDYFHQPGRVAFLEWNVKGVGIVIPNPAGFGDYLDVFAANEMYEGFGVGGDVLAAILDSQKSTQPKLAWRSRKDRPVNEWYLRISKGHQEFVGSGGALFNGYWIGLNFDEARSFLNYTQAKPSNFK